jgi:hypothetical protein
VSDFSACRRAVTRRCPRYACSTFTPPAKICDVQHVYGAARSSVRAPRVKRCALSQIRRDFDEADDII